MEKAEIGLIGLAVSEFQPRSDIVEKGNKIAVFNCTPDKTDEFYESATIRRSRSFLHARRSRSLAQLIRSATPDHFIAIKAGEPVDQQMELCPYLSGRATS